MTYENDSTTTRAGFLGGAAKLGAAGALGAGALPALLGASSAAAAVKSKKIAVIEQHLTGQHEHGHVLDLPLFDLQL